MNKSALIIISLITLLILGGGLLLIVANQPKPAPNLVGKLDQFAQCLNNKGLTMYGAAWCTHCQAQKARFGDAFKFVKYIECPATPQVCTAANITGYPTWIASDGTRLSGEQELTKLAEITGCQLPK